MGTRSIITVNKNGKHYAEIYKHWDGYPTNILFLIARGLAHTFEDGRQVVMEVVPKVLFGLMSGHAFRLPSAPKSGGDVYLQHYNPDGGPIPIHGWEQWEEFLYEVDLHDNGSFGIKFTEKTDKGAFKSHTLELPRHRNFSNEQHMLATWDSIIKEALRATGRLDVDSAMIFEVIKKEENTEVSS